MYCEKYMLEAARLAEMGRGHTSPNPLVGAVVVKNDQIVGVGFHRKAGTEHAEVLALNMAGAMAEGAELYVTLEPCAHHGKTPPCADKIIRHGVKKVYVGIQDPNPLVAGKGIEILRAAGIEVEVGFLESYLREQNRFFLHWITKQLPYINLKFAMTLDGKIATCDGDSKWITNEASRAKVQELRHISDAVLVGVDTVIADNPRLNYRGDCSEQPYKIICDSRLRIAPEATVIRNQPEKTIIATVTDDENKIKALQALGVNIIRCKAAPDNRVDLRDLCQKLKPFGILSILVEGGAHIHGAFFDSGLVNRVYAFIAPKLMGQSKGLSPIMGKGIKDMQSIPALENVSHESFEEDILITGDYPENQYLQGR